MFKANLVHISDQVLHKGQAHAVLLPGVVGEFEVDDNHIPIVSLLAKGRILVRVGPEKSSEDKSIQIQQGLMRFDGKELFAVVE